MAYDIGHAWEAKRIAVAIYSIVHDGTGNLSLLTQLGIRHAMRFPSPSDRANKSIPFAMHPLVKYTVRSIPGEAACSFFEARRMEAISDTTRYLKTDNWWSEIILTNGAGLSFSRKNLILTTRNQENGGHLEPWIRDKDYRLMKSFRGEGIRFKIDGQVISKSENGVILPTIRHMGFEIIWAIMHLPDDTFSEIMKSKNGYDYLGLEGQTINVATRPVIEKW